MLIIETIGSLIGHVLPGSVVNSLSLSLDFLNVYRNVILTEIFIMIFLKIIICNELPSVYSNVIIYARQNWIDWMNTTFLKPVLSVVMKRRCFYYIIENLIILRYKKILSISNIENSCFSSCRILTLNSIYDVLSLSKYFIPPLSLSFLEAL